MFIPHVETIVYMCYTTFMKLGLYLDDKRRALDLSAEQIAAKVGITRRQWDRLVKGASVDMRFTTALRISDALEVSVTSLARADEFAEK